MKVIVRLKEISKETGEMKKLTLQGVENISITGATVIFYYFDEHKFPTCFNKKEVFNFYTINDDMTKLKQKELTSEELSFLKGLLQSHIDTNDHIIKYYKENESPALYEATKADLTMQNAMFYSIIDKIEA